MLFVNKCPRCQQAPGTLFCQRTAGCQNLPWAGAFRRSHFFTNFYKSPHNMPVKIRLSGKAACRRRDARIYKAARPAGQQKNALYGIFSFHTQRCVQKQAVILLPPCTKNQKRSIMNLHCAAEAVAYGGHLSVCRGRGVLAPRSCYAFFIVLTFPIIPLSGSFFNLFLRHLFCTQAVRAHPFGLARKDEKRAQGGASNSQREGHLTAPPCTPWHSPSVYMIPIGLRVFIDVCFLASSQPYLGKENRKRRPSMKTCGLFDYLKRC
mgnify:CR=1 FL=1